MVDNLTVEQVKELILSIEKATEIALEGSHDAATHVVVAFNEKTGGFSIYRSCEPLLVDRDCFVMCSTPLIDGAEEEEESYLAVREELIDSVPYLLRLDLQEFLEDHNWDDYSYERIK